LLHIHNKGGHTITCPSGAAAVGNVLFKSVTFTARLLACLLACCVTLEQEGKDDISHCLNIQTFLPFLFRTEKQGINERCNSELQIQKW